MISIEGMTWNKGTGRLVTEASDHGPDLPWLRVYSDTCDVGLDVYSPKTGRTVRFRICHTERDYEGELRWWDLEPSDSQQRREMGVVLRIYND